MNLKKKKNIAAAQIENGATIDRLKDTQRSLSFTPFIFILSVWFLFNKFVYNIIALKKKSLHYKYKHKHTIYYYYFLGGIWFDGEIDFYHLLNLTELYEISTVSESHSRIRRCSSRENIKKEKRKQKWYWEHPKAH